MHNAIVSRRTKQQNKLKCLDILNFYNLIWSLTKWICVRIWRFQLRLFIELGKFENHSIFNLKINHFTPSPHTPPIEVENVSESRITLYRLKGLKLRLDHHILITYIISLPASKNYPSTLQLSVYSDGNIEICKYQCEFC